MRRTYTQNIGPSSGLGANYDNTGLACQCANQDIALGLSGCANLPQAYTGAPDGLAQTLGYPQHLAGGNMTCPVMNNQMASQYHNYKLVRRASGGPREVLWEATQAILSPPGRR